MPSLGKILEVRNNRKSIVLVVIDSGTDGILVDQRLLKIKSEDVMLCITSAGDNLLDYLVSANPRRIHAVDLNPNQNHLLELKIAAFQSLPYVDVWKMFGEGKYPDFRKTLISKLSPHMSSQACQYWLSHTSTFTSARGLYETGGSRRVVGFRFHS